MVDQFNCLFLQCRSYKTQNSVTFLARYSREYIQILNISLNHNLESLEITIRLPSNSTWTPSSSQDEYVLLTTYFKFYFLHTLQPIKIYWKLLFALYFISSYPWNKLNRLQLLYLDFFKQYYNHNLNQRIMNNINSVSADILIIGGGPSGSGNFNSFGWHPQTKGLEQAHFVDWRKFNRQPYILSGAVVKPRVFKDLLPDVDFNEIPFNAKVAKDSTVMLRRKRIIQITIPCSLHE